MADSCRVHNSREGRDCIRSLNATRAAVGLDPIDGICSTCETVGACLTPQACLKPIEVKPIRRRLFTRTRFTASRAFLVGALFAVPGVALFVVEGLRYFLNQH